MNVITEDVCHWRKKLVSDISHFKKNKTLLVLQESSCVSLFQVRTSEKCLKQVTLLLCDCKRDVGIRKKTNVHVVYVDFVHPTPELSVRDSNTMSE